MNDSRRVIVLGNSIDQSSRNEIADAKYLWSMSVCCIIFLQKIAIPVGDNTLSINYITIPIVLAGLYMRGQLRLDCNALSLFSIFCASTFISNIVGLIRENVSLGGFSLLCYTQIWFCFAPAGISSGRKAMNEAFTKIMIAFAIAGICQFVFQGHVDISYLFPVDNLVPEWLLMQGYGGTQPLFYGSNILKSNGVCFTEPAFYSQFIAIAIVIELENRRRWLYILIFLSALVFSFSGTGIIILLFYGSYALVRSKRFDILVIVCGVGLCGIFFGSALNIQIILNRINEFTSPGSSGHARFISIFLIIDENQVNDPLALLFGFGSGQIVTYIKRTNFTAFDPTWGKVFFEYGVVGFSAYASFLWQSLYRFRNELSVPCMLMYLLLGGYLVDPNIIGTVVLFSKWASIREEVSRK